MRFPAAPSLHNLCKRPILKTAECLLQVVEPLALVMVEACEHFAGLGLNSVNLNAIEPGDKAMNESACAIAYNFHSNSSPSFLGGCPLPPPPPPNFLFFPLSLLPEQKQSCKNGQMYSWVHCTLPIRIS